MLDGMFNHAASKGWMVSRRSHMRSCRTWVCLGTSKMPVKEVDGISTGLVLLKRPTTSSLNGTEGLTGISSMDEALRG